MRRARRLPFFKDESARFANLRFDIRQHHFRRARSVREYENRDNFVKRET